ncbi:carboxylate--amine ligase [Aeromicrobium sp. Root495]|nr:carboxylate--amine ligase [Aeromicrobium sp. Root495]
MVAAFEGWNDAGDAASSVVEHLVEAWDAEVLAELDPEDFYDFQVHRPHIHPDEDGTRVLIWPTPTLYHARVPHSERDVLLLRAPEPNMRWKTFCSTIMGIARLAGVTELVTLGALLADAPHTRPVPVSGSSSDPVLSERLALRPSTYSGPVGINSVLSETAALQGIPSISLWAAVPHYLAEPPCHKATLALLGSLEDAVGVALPQGDLEELAEAWQRGADEVASSDPEISEYVEELENENDANELPEASGDAIAREFERYLRRRDTDPPTR